MQQMHISCKHCTFGLDKNIFCIEIRIYILYFIVNSIYMIYLYEGVSKAFATFFFPDSIVNFA